MPPVTASLSPVTERLLTDVLLPRVTVILPDSLMTTLELAIGTASPLQLAAVFHDPPLALLQVTVLRNGRLSSGSMQCAAAPRTVPAASCTKTYATYLFVPDCECSKAILPRHAMEGNQITFILAISYILRIPVHERVVFAETSCD